MAVKQCETGIVRREIHFHSLISVDHHYVLHHTRRADSRHAGQFKTVPVEMNGMNVVTRIAHPYAGIACLHCK